jgi:hypothetical protein
MKYLFLLVQDLEGKQESGAYGFIADILPAFDSIKEHLKTQLVYFAGQNIRQDDIFIKSIGYTNCLNTITKFDKYKQLNVLLVLFAIIVLVP